MPAPTHVVPLGDRAVLATFAAEADAAAYARALAADRPPWLADVVPAYLSVGLHLRPGAIGLRAALAWAQEFRAAPTALASPRLRHVIPVCCERNLDLAAISRHLSLSEAEVIRIYVACIYTVYAVGFVPGFPYRGDLPPQLCGVPRLAEPRLRVPAGSVGLTGRQTGIYPLERPGGWPILGRTPLELVNLDDAYFPLHVGDEVQFIRIDEAEYARLHGRRLSPG